jgi:trafficking protein particle complex subunit 3
MFLNINADVINWEAGDAAFTLSFGENPMAEFVELPVHLQDLRYLNLLCGVIRGALEMVQTEVDVTFIKDMLHGDDRNEMRVEHRGAVKIEMNDDYKET